MKTYTLVAGELLHRRFENLLDSLPQIAVFAMIAAPIPAQNQPPSF